LAVVTALPPDGVRASLADDETIPVFGVSWAPEQNVTVVGFEKAEVSTF
jgi:hypothetical protein